jgi:hypothetical protein
LILYPWLGISGLEIPADRTSEAPKDFFGGFLVLAPAIESSGRQGLPLLAALPNCLSRLPLKNYPG